MESEVPTLAGNETLPPDAPPASHSIRSASDLDTTVDGDDLDRMLDRAAGDPTRVGRHEIDGRLGAGGMGVVYSAYDPELDRRLAIKVIRPMGGGGNSQTSRGRLMREAQAMARVSHPNVITVFDVGTIDDRIYIAMELIDGETLASWVRHEDDDSLPRPRPWREIIEVFAQAAEGLIAAHDAQLVHRDFKPQNVLVGRDGVARVLDFGLARASNSVDFDAAAEPTHPDAPSINSQLDSKLTRTGAMIGTPAYMSPEQIEGRSADARSDQFSFCVSLWEALYDARPFSGKTMAELSFAVLEGQLDEPTGPRAREVPAHVRAALTRGLSARASERYPSMRALLDALLDDPHARRRRVAVIGGSALAVALLGGLAASALATGPGEACRAGVDRIAATWNGERAARLTTRFSQGGLDLGDATAQRTRSALDAWAGDWASDYRAACDATHEAQSQSLESLELRLGCLGDAATRFETTVELLLAADAPTLAAAAEIVAALPASARCAHVEALRGEPTSSDPDTAARIARARSQLTTIAARREAGDFAGARVTIQALTADDALAAHPALGAELLAERGRLAFATGDYANAETRLKEAYWKATELGHDALGSSTSTLLVQVVGHARARSDDGLDWWHNAKAVYARMQRPAPPRLARHHAALLRESGDYLGAREELSTLLADGDASKPEDRAATLELLALIDITLARHDDARAHVEALEDTIAEHFGPDHPRTVAALTTRAELDTETGKWDEALAALDRARTLARRIYGDAHPVVARASGRISDLHRKRERFQRARSEAEQALEQAEASVGPEHPLTGEMAYLLGLAHISEKNYPAAHTLMERAHDIAARAYGDDAVEVSAPITGLGMIAEARRNWDEAEAQYQRALAIQERVLGRDHPRSAELHSRLGALDFWRSDYNAAADHYFRTLKIRERTLGLDHPTIPLAIMHAAGSYDYTGDLQRAGELHARALEAFRRIHGPDYHYVATASLNLARVRERQGRFAEALELTDEGARVWGLDHDPEHFEMAYVYTLRGRCLIGLDRSDEAVEPLEHALRIRKAAGPDLVQRDTVLADTRFALGRALWQRDRSRARKLIEAAEAGYLRAGDYARFERGEIEAWKAAH